MTDNMQDNKPVVLETENKESSSLPLKQDGAALPKLSFAGYINLIASTLYNDGIKPNLNKFFISTALTSVTVIVSLSAVLMANVKAPSQIPPPEQYSTLYVTAKENAYLRISQDGRLAFEGIMPKNLKTSWNASKSFTIVTEAPEDFSFTLNKTAVRQSAFKAKTTIIPVKPSTTRGRRK